VEAIPAPAWQYGVLGVVAFVFGVAIVWLWRSYLKLADTRTNELKVITDERSGWTAERKALADANENAVAELRAEYEEKHRQILEHYTDALKEDRDAAREHEDLVRREFGELMEEVSTRAHDSSKSIVEILNKFYDRFVGPRPRY
jgi:hypothetical protein